MIRCLVIPVGGTGIIMLNLSVLAEVTGFIESSEGKLSLRVSCVGLRGEGVFQLFDPAWIRTQSAQHRLVQSGRLGSISEGGIAKRRERLRGQRLFLFQA